MNAPVQIGNATLYQGDSAELLPSFTPVDLVLTDPPYGLPENARKQPTRGTRSGQGLGVPPTDYGNWRWDVLPDAAHIGATVSAANRAIIWGGNYFALPAASGWLVWDKINTGDFADCELAWTNIKMAVRLFRHMWNGMIRDSERGYPRVHPTQKPIKLMEWCLSFTPDALTVLDPFMGVGTTGIACANLGKSFIGIERDAHYFDLACKRIEAAQAQGRLFA